MEEMLYMVQQRGKLFFDNEGPAYLVVRQYNNLKTARTKALQCSKKNWKYTVLHL